MDDEKLRDPAEVVSLYSQVAPAYDVWGRMVDGRVRRRAVAHAAVQDGDAVLEVGAGTGILLAQLAGGNRRGRTVGVDLATGMLSRARARFDAAGRPDVELRVGDACALPFADATFDVVCCAYVLDILPDERIEAALREFRRVLRPGGRLVLVNVTHAERRAHRLPELLYRSGLPLTANCRAIAVLPQLRRAGFGGVHREYSAQWLLPSEILVGDVVAPAHVPVAVPRAA